jgi:hypothetical protein
LNKSVHAWQVGMFISMPCATCGVDLGIASSTQCVTFGPATQRTTVCRNRETESFCKLRLFSAQAHSLCRLNVAVGSLEERPDFFFQSSPLAKEALRFHLPQHIRSQAEAKQRTRHAKQCPRQQACIQLESAGLIMTVRQRDYARRPAGRT